MGTFLVEVRMCFTILKYCGYSALYNATLQRLWPLHDLWPWQWPTGTSTIIVTEFGGRRAFLNKLTSRWPLICWVATKSWRFPQLAKPYPRAKFQLRRSKHGRTHSDTDRQTYRVNLLILERLQALLSKPTPTWPQLIPTWPLIPAMHYGLVRDSSHQIWWPYGISKQVDLWVTLADPYMTFDPSNALCSGQGFFPPNLVAIRYF